MSKPKRPPRPRVCQCGDSFFPTFREQDLCPQCAIDIEHDANVEMFGDDADYLEHAGLADKIGNK